MAKIQEIVYSERAVEALIFRLQGRSFSEIGRIMDVSRQRACQLVKQACLRMVRHPEDIEQIPEPLRKAYPEVSRTATRKRRRRRGRHNVTTKTILKVISK